MVKRIVMTLIAAVAVGGLVYAFSGPTQSDAPGPPPAGVESVTPAGGDLDLRQVTIAADLAPGYTGYLLLDGVEVPRDDLQIVDALNTITLKPLPDSDYEVLEPSRHCATVVYRRIGEPESDSSSYQWCFSLH
ncbi:MAG: hypothetical protein QOJ69_2362 [Actinomycetota bacterium]|jgi:hypothetical protein|nr:hypothetical protein [Actinomycetota bacterium]